MQTREEVLIEQITKASSEYYTIGSSFLSDKEFDALVEELEQINPNAEILSKREIHSDDWNYQLETLPTKLYSIKKVKTWREIQNWMIFIKNKVKGININEVKLVLTPKYDGCKLVNFKDNFYTRYEGGEQGYNVTKRIANDVKTTSPIGFEGELIISKSNFKKYCEGYTSSRNFIPAIFSSKERLVNQDKVEYIKYSLYPDGLTNYSKQEELIYCNSFNKVKVPYKVVKYRDLTEQTIIDFYFENISDFEYDGVVIDIDSWEIRNQLGETQKYLDCCRAYKGDALFDDIKESKIESITWQMSRYGKLTPVAQITPVVINEGVVSNVSLYNAAYIRDNNIFIGTRVKVTRKGKINPKIVEFIDKPKIFGGAIPSVCPFCGEPLVWNNSQVDIICNNSNCKEKEIQKLYFFFKTIGIQNFGLECVRSFVNAGFSFEDFFNNGKIYSTKIEGIGDITKNTFIDNLEEIRKGIKIEKLQEGSGCFQGMSQSTLKILNTLNVDMEFYFNDRYYNEVYKRGLELENIGKLTLEDYLDGLYNFYKEFWPIVKKYFEIYNNSSEKIKEDRKQRFIGKNICFTGFRNNEWNSIVENEGGKILSSVTSICNMLVVKDINSTSSKMQKAKQMGIEIMSIEDFQNLIEN